MIARLLRTSGEGLNTAYRHWAVENEGVAPDIDVENTPKEVIAGNDPQLERAVEEAMRLLKTKPAERMTKEPAWPTWGKRGVPAKPTNPSAPASPKK